jgi:hypothetical protein
MSEHTKSTDDPAIAATAIRILAEPFAPRRLAKNGVH